jgi:hypothetical protein
MPFLVNIDVALVNIRKGKEERSIPKIAVYKMRKDRAHSCYGGHFVLCNLVRH